MEFKVFKNENDKILKEYWLTQSEWDALDKTTVQDGDIYHIVGTIDKGDLSADVNASLAKGDSSLQKPTATLAKESFVKVGIDGSQKFDENSYVVAPSTDGTSGQVLKKTATGTEWANESGKLYVHTLYCKSNSNDIYRIIAYSTKQELFTFDYIKAHKSCLNSAISTVTKIEDGSTTFDRVIANIEIGETTPQSSFEILSFGATPAKTLLTFYTDEVVEL